MTSELDRLLEDAPLAPATLAGAAGRPLRVSGEAAA